MDTARRESRIVGSGLGPGASFSRRDLAHAARLLLPQTPVSGYGGGAREDRAVMGGRTGGRIQGRARGAQWVVAADRSQGDLLRAVAPLVEIREGDAETFATSDDL